MPDRGVEPDGPRGKLVDYQGLEELKKRRNSVRNSDTDEPRIPRADTDPENSSRSDTRPESAREGRDAQTGRTRSFINGRLKIKIQQDFLYAVMMYHKRAGSGIGNTSYSPHDGTKVRQSKPSS